ncbi:MAG: bifunctional methylenetetrahydrofolate dehydrogenase/methenyltetrahydrofolate cyclohydrolase FolD [Thermoflexales bacterium]|nr:bifunctional methylenetetrahydrofolate dehydrogenase/methenyltetrahydrofolate cyclohydrolase FolD [Thermoflexales bacterium]MDW8351743.1 bifunctional methylenetetrahydrofolate dehydrogenase/methenyltetrahydrofolate cyclohydrolase FolD [Anaerolineae bacterium]
MATIIDGAAIAATIRAEIKDEVARLKAEHGVTPGLATVLVGDNPASATYVRNKRKACAEVGIASFGYELPAHTTQDELMRLVHELGARDDVHGILVQLPLPAHLDEQAILSAVPLHKDVDGFNPVNLGLLGVKGRRPPFAPCTPQGCIELLDRSGIRIAGRRAVVLGRSAIVGLPVALMLLARDATVTICHSQTPNLASITRTADILIAAIGKPRFVTGDMVKAGVVVIDVGINRVTDAGDPRRARLVGDVDFDEVSESAAAITPVPGGVGPMTIAMLLRNTLVAARRRAAEQKTSEAA